VKTSITFSDVESYSASILVFVSKLLPGSDDLFYGDDISAFSCLLDCALDTIGDWELDGPSRAAIVESIDAIKLMLKVKP
jgi:hypothetical protein